MCKPSLPALVPLWERAMKLPDPYKASALEDIRNGQADMYERFHGAFEACQRALAHWEQEAKVGEG